MRTTQIVVRGAERHPSSRPPDRTKLRSAPVDWPIPSLCIGIGEANPSEGRLPLLAFAKPRMLSCLALSSRRSLTGGWPAATNSLVMYVVRVMRGIATEVHDVARGRTPTHKRLRDSLVGIALATIGVALICALLALVFEQQAKQTQITSFGSALFWTLTQLLTVSSSIQNPISTAARVLDVAMEAYAITVIASLAGAMGAFLVKRGRELEQVADKAQQLT